MVQIKLSVAFILAVTAIAPIVAVPVGEKTTVPAEVSPTPNAGSNTPAVVPQKPKMAVLDSTGTPETGSKAAAKELVSEHPHSHKGKGKHTDQHEREVTGHQGHGHRHRHRHRYSGKLNLEEAPHGRHHKRTHRKKEKSQKLHAERAEVVPQEKVDPTPLAARDDFDEVFEREVDGPYIRHNGKRHHKTSHRHRHVDEVAPQENASPQLDARDDFAEEFERSFDDNDDLAARDDFDEMFDLE